MRLLPSLNALSLRSAIVLGSGVGILAPALVLGPMLVWDSYRQRLDQRVRGLLSQYAGMLEQSLPPPLWSFDSQAAEFFVAAVMLNPEVVSITVSDNSGKILVLSDQPQRRTGTILSEKRLIRWETIPIGNFVIEMSTTGVEQDFRETALRLGGALAVQFVLSFLLLLVLFERRMMRPLRQLSADADRLAQGDLQQPVLQIRLDELGDLARRLEQMRQNLAALLQQRDAQTESLQRELAEQALRISPAKFAAIFQSSPVALLVATRRDGYRIIDINDAWLRQLGRKREDVIGRNGEEVGFWRDLRDRVTALRTLEREGEIRNYEAWLNVGDGKTHILCLLSGTMVELGSESVLILAYEDVTESRRRETKVRELNATLEQRVAQRTEALKQANHELITAMDTLRSTQVQMQLSERMAALGSMVAGVAHEPNTRIGTCVTVASTLHDLNRDFGRLMERGLTRSALTAYVSNTGQATEMLLRNLSNAAELISGFKQVAVDQTSAQRRAFHLHELVADTMLTMGPVIKRTPHSVEQHIPQGIAMDSYPGPLGQVLGNLINNALLHAFEHKPHGRVTLSARLIDADWVELVAQDDGCGIAQAHLGRLFDPFFTTKLGRGGNGLGLSIVYNLVTEVLGGSLQGESELEQGSRFILLLPMVAPDSAQA